MIQCYEPLWSAPQFLQLVGFSCPLVAWKTEARDPLWGVGLVAMEKFYLSAS